MNNEWFKRRDAARFLRSTYELRVTEGSLATMATRGGGPKFAKQGRYAYYLKVHLIEWAASRCSGFLDSTSTPHNGNTRRLFVYEQDSGDLEDADYRNTDDRGFDEVTKLLEEQMDAQLERFDYHKELFRI